MQFTDAVLSKCSKEFLDELAPHLEHLVFGSIALYYTELYDYGYGVIPKKLIIDNSSYEFEDEASDYCNSIVPILVKYSRCFDNLQATPILDSDISFKTVCRVFAYDEETEIEIMESMHKEDEFSLQDGILINKSVLSGVNSEFLSELVPALRKVLEVYDIVYCEYHEGEFPRRLLIADVNLSDNIYDVIYSITSKYVIDAYDGKIPFIGTNYIDWSYRIFCKRMED